MKLTIWTIVWGATAVIIIAFIIARVRGTKGTWTSSQEVLLDDHRDSPKEAVKSVGESECRQVLEKIYNKPFPSARPDFLANPVTGSPLELDCYNEELKLAVEYNGRQHYEYVSQFFPTIAEWQCQLYRDVIKKKLCQESGVHLIIVPWNVSNIKDYILNEIARWSRDKSSLEKLVEK
jgi:hypothetical protein